MKNSFNIEVNLNEVPLKPFEWDDFAFINNIKVIRVNSKCIKDLLGYECIVDSTCKTLLLSDTQNSIVIRLDKNNKISKRSFLLFNKDLEVCEYACNLKPIKINYSIGKNKIIYCNILKEEENIKKYVLKTIMETEDEAKLKYLYYKCYNRVDDYSKDMFIKLLENKFEEKYFELYELMSKNQGA